MGRKPKDISQLTPEEQEKHEKYKATQRERYRKKVGVKTDKDKLLKKTYKINHKIFLLTQELSEIYKELNK
jgi:hypothetical protein